MFIIDQYVSSAGVQEALVYQFCSGKGSGSKYLLRYSILAFVLVYDTLSVAGTAHKEQISISHEKSKQIYSSCALLCPLEIQWNEHSRLHLRETKYIKCK